MDIKLLKYNARRQLGGDIFAENWLVGLLITLVYFAIVFASVYLIAIIVTLLTVIISGMPGRIMDLMSLFVEDADYGFDVFFEIIKLEIPIFIGETLAFNLCSVMIISPLTYGVNKAFHDLVMGGVNIRFNSLFDGIRNYGKVLLIGFMRWLFIALWSLLFIIPGIIKEYAYSLVYYIHIDHPEYTWRQCLKESERLMQGYKLDFFILRLSFIGWFILGQLALYVGVLWVYPYVFCTEANFYAWRIANDDAYPDTPTAPAENDFSCAYGTAPADTAPETDVNTPFSEPADEAEEIPAEEEIPEDYETPDEDADDAYTFVADESEPVDEE